MDEPTKVSSEDYANHTEEYMGFCTNCKDFTTSEVEPDAEGYKCEDCGQRTVVGAEQALLLGLIEIE